MNPGDHVLQAASFNAFFRDFHGTGGEIDVYELRVGAAELMGEKNDGVARSAAGDQRAESMAKIAPTAVAVIIQRGEVVEHGEDEAPMLVVRIAQRVRVQLVLAADLRSDMVDVRGHRRLTEKIIPS